MLRLKAHYQGEGNSSRRIYVAESMWRNLHYKSERALPFATFISKAQKMLNIYYKNNEPKSEGAQVRWLLDQIKDSSLQATIASLNIDVEKDPEHKIWDFQKCANHIASQIRKADPADTKMVSGVQVKPPSTRKGIQKDGEVFTGTYSPQEWRALSPEERSAVFTARSHKQGGVNQADRGKFSAHHQTKKFRTLAKRLKNQEKIIASLKRRSSTSDLEIDEQGDEEPANDAGNAFGGRAGKVNKKKQKLN